jgi:malate dehydrogenase (oxaloacetate-decarboxylating)
VHATEINEEMKMAAVYAIADLITPSELEYEYVIPHAFDKRVAAAVSEAVAKAAVRSGAARKSTV